MPIIKHTLVLSCLLAVTTIAVAQTPKTTTKLVTNKLVLPKLKTALGNRSDSIVTASIDETLQLVNQRLSITDDKKTSYAISSYQCLYKRKGVTENEETGKVSPVTSTVNSVFKTTPLSAIWIKTISEQLKVGEELFFYDIVVKSPEGRLMFAPNLKLLVQ